MITEAKIDNLFRCIRNNENATGFDLRRWMTANLCGTYGCLLGNDFIAMDRMEAIPSNNGGTDILCSMPREGGGYELETPMAAAETEYGISKYVSCWLFAAFNLSWGCCGRNGRCVGNFLNTDARDPLDQEAAIRRIRKLIYYVLHKRELMYDDSGCVRESARRTEGDLGICLAVKKKADETCRQGKPRKEATLAI